ncbi:hypothetical protein [Chishuiella sp.]|uniref:hypothetical protein n=1 Tax=Chishuiella sp. TaxID=1969467 RepID=UPI0028A786FB|nr:hypothetical protein [Chishuiella sp.]
MKKEIIDYINIFLAIAFGLLLILNLGVRYKNREYDKMYWNAEIYSSDENSSIKDENIIKIIDAKFYNNFNNSKTGLNSESLRKNRGILTTKIEENVLFHYSDNLLPDSLYLKYFSIDERKFYELSTKLPYEKIKNIADKYKEDPILFLEIKPTGKVILKIKEKENKEYEIIDSYNAKISSGELEMLTYEEYMNKKFNRYEGIENITDFSDLLQNKYKWLFKVKIDDDENLQSAYSYSYTYEHLNLFMNNDTLDFQKIPRYFSIDWANHQQEYSIHYNFNDIQILNAFRSLNKIDSNEPISMTFILFKDKYPQCDITRGNESISLENLYPEKPIRHSK